MNILILCKKFPYPLKEGEPIAISYLAKALYENGCRVSLFVLNTSKHYFDPNDLPDNENFYHNIYSVKTNNSITASGAVKSILKGKSYILSRFYSKKYELKLAEILVRNKYDIVQFETVYMAYYIPTVRKHSNAAIALRTHNVEHLIWERVAETSPSILKKWYLNYQNKSLRAFEIKRLNECDILVSITSEDLNKFTDLGFEKKSVVAPVGINLNNYLLGNDLKENSQSIAFIGALDWMPNQDGIVWFIEKVWPMIEKEFPRVNLHIAGKNTPDWIFKKAARKIIVHGEIDDAKEFIRSSPVLIAPLFSGSGIKIKVLEGMALGRVVVTTSIGAEGISAIHGNHLLIADDVLSFFENIKSCFEDKTKVKKISTAAIEFIRTNFNNNTIALKVMEAYQKAKS